LIIKTSKIEHKILLAILNSRVMEFWLVNKGKLQGNQFQVDKIPLMSMPLIKLKCAEQKLIIELVDKIITVTKTVDYFKNSAKQDKVREYERQIDQIVYKLYGLAKEEIQIIENSSS